MPKKPTQKTTPTPTTTAQPVNLKKIKAKVDPEILAIRAKARVEIKELQLRRNSGSVLKNILEKQVPRLTRDDYNRLILELTKVQDPNVEAVSTPAAKPEPEESTDPWTTE
jgi:hypothetical protein